MKTNFFLLVFMIFLNAILKVHAQGPELITNGDFSDGNSGFSTDYTYCNSSGCLGPEGYYAVGSNPNSYHGLFFGTDHTSGTGNLMIVNGDSSANKNIWCETVLVSPGVDYTFSYWLATMYWPSPAVIQAKINGVNVGSTFTAPSSNYVWLQFSIIWNSGGNTSANICLVDVNTAYGGNDFGLDDISFKSNVDNDECPLPANLSASNITGSSAKLNWDAVQGAEGYKIRYKVSGTNPWILKNSWGNAKNLNHLSPNTAYTWEVKTFCTINPGLSSDWSAKQHFTTGSLRVGDESEQVSFQIYPNPAEDHATIQFTLAQSSHIYIKVYDVSGKEIEILVNAELQQGEHSLPINTNHFSKGIYMVKLISDFGIENQKLIVQ